MSAGETFTVTSTPDDNSDGTLRKEIADALANGMSDDIIEFDASLSGETITLGSILGINEDLTLANRILKTKLTRKIKKLTKRVKVLKRKGKITAVKRLNKNIRKLKKRVRGL